MTTPSNSNVRLTDTTKKDSFTLIRPNNSHVTFKFNLDSTRPGMTQITLPRGSSWGPTPHWHESYTEYLLVLKGRVTVMLDGVTITVTPESGIQTVHKNVVHEWKRADADSVEKDDEDVVVEEWTDPADGSKQVMFRNLFSTLDDQSSHWGWRLYPQILLTMDTYDNFQLLTPIGAPWWLSQTTTKSVFAMGKVVAWALGLKAWYDQYTPVELRGIAADLAAGHEVGEVNKRK